MAKSGRTPVITGNWKMHKTIEQAAQFIESVATKVKESQVRLFLAVPFTAIAPLHKKVVESKLPFVIGAQNMHDLSEGAFTGEIAAPMLQEAGAQFVLLGHSERRHIFGEKNDFINRKVLRALSIGMTVVLCVGETLKEREAGETLSLLQQQLTECLQGVTAEAIEDVIIAYEPVWAIGTGKVATGGEAEKAHSSIRENIRALFGEQVADKIIIQYGGSVHADNAAELLSQENIDGLLVGGASLDPHSFYNIIETCEKVL